MERALVAGGAGFIGSHLCDRLVGEGHEVLCADNLITGRAANVAHLRQRPGFHILRRDVSRSLRVEGPLDQVYHLASPASPVDFEARGVEIMMAGALGTHRLLELARAKGATFLLASTSEVYGDPLVHPQPEDYCGNVNPVGPRAPYDESKRYAEAITSLYHRTGRAEVRIARIFNTYGPRLRLDDGRVIPNFIAQILQGEPLTIYGDGKHTRSFCYVDDMVEGLVRLMHSRETRPVNLGSPEELTIAQLADLMEELTHRPLGRKYMPLPADDPHCRQPDIRRARKVLGWEPRVPLREGLARTFAAFGLPR